DFTKSRQYSFYDGGEVCHVSTADPFCPELREMAIKTAAEIGLDHHEKATYVCIEGPRYSTRAESRFFKDFVKADVIGMTLVPECVLAREAEICYLSIATVTDYDVWAEKPVSSREVIETLKKNVQNTRKLLMELIPRIPAARERCSCGEALKDAKL
ncbi:MAG: S-methyl-5'-thioadenosine phosphorylase, partial [Nitrososphaerales archaeon]